MNLIDTADSYGPKVSEELIAEALYPYPAGAAQATSTQVSATAEPNSGAVMLFCFAATGV